MDRDQSRRSQVLVRALGRSTLRRVLFAFLLFRMVEMGTWVAFVVWAFEQGGAGASGLITVAQFAPGVVVAPLAAALASRVARPAALRTGYALQGVAVSWTAVVLFLDAPFWVVAASAAIVGSALVLTRPVHHALIPEIALTPDELMAGNTASTGLEGLASFLGPAVAAGLLVVTDAGWIFVGLGGAGLLCVLVTLRIEVFQEAVTGATSFLQDTREGLRAVVRHRAARVLTLLASAAYMVIGLLGILAVVLALDLLEIGPAGPGLMTSAMGAGALLGSLAVAWLIGRRRLTSGLAAGVLLAGLSIATAGNVTTPDFAILLYAGAGAGLAAFHISSRTLLHRNVTAQLQTRVFGVQEALLMGGAALGSAAVPVLVHTLGVRGAFVASALVLPLVTLMVWPGLRRLDDRTVVPAPWLDLLEQIPMFALLPRRQLETVAVALHPVGPFQAGQSVLSQGESGDRYYVIASGSVEVLRGDRQVATLAAGDGFGEIALLRDVPRTATIRALEPLELLALDREPFLQAVTGSDASFRTVNREVDERLRDVRGDDEGERTDQSG